MRSTNPFPSAPTVKRCARVPSSHAFQWRYINSSATCAFTGFADAAFERELLHASSVHAGYTRDVNAILSPPGDHTGPVAPPESVVSCLRDAPIWSATQSWLSAMYAMRFPSGDQRASVTLVDASGNAMGAPPFAATLYVIEDRLFDARFVVRTENSTVDPLGAICGSDTAFTASKLSMLRGCCCCFSCAASGAKGARSATTIRVAIRAGALGMRASFRGDVSRAVRRRKLTTGG